MATRERPVDRGALRAAEILAQLGRELRAARLDRGLSLGAVADAVGLSASTLSRIERGHSPAVALVTLARTLPVVGLELSARAYPGGQPIRDAAHLALLGAFRAQLHGSLRWATEVPLPEPRDQRAWDATVAGRGWIYGVEAETAPRDVQALVRRLELKRRDAGFNGVVLLLRRGRRAGEFLAAARPVLAATFSTDGRRALELLRAGVDPGGSVIVVI